MKDNLPHGKDYNGNYQPLRSDNCGRLIAGYFVRDITHTGFAELNSNAETTILAGSTNHYHDLCLLQCTNTSSNAVRVSIQDGTGGSTILDVSTSALLSFVESFDPPIPQSEKGQIWTVKFAESDISNTTVNVFGMFFEAEEPQILPD